MYLSCNHSNKMSTNEMRNVYYYIIVIISWKLLLSRYKTHVEIKNISHTRTHIYTHTLTRAHTPVYLKITAMLRVYRTLDRHYRIVTVVTRGRGLFRIQFEVERREISRRRRRSAYGRRGSRTAVG